MVYRSVVLCARAPTRLGLCDISTLRPWAAHNFKENYRGKGQADVPAEQPSSCSQAWLPYPHEHPCRSRNRGCTSQEGSRKADCIVMLPPHSKLSSPADFRRTIKGGSRAGSRTVVVHYNDASAEVAASGPRFGLVVSKAVGNAVIRHRTSRRLRHVCMGLAADPELALPATADIVIRALPGAADASSVQLERDIRRALRKVRGGAAGTASARSQRQS